MIDISMRIGICCYFIAVIRFEKNNKIENLINKQNNLVIIESQNSHKN